jgi:hypothetical protein
VGTLRSIDHFLEPVKIIIRHHVEGAARRDPRRAMEAAHEQRCSGYRRRPGDSSSGFGGIAMPLRVKVGLVVLAVIFVSLGIMLLIGHLQGDGGTDKNNSNVDSNTSQRG